MDLRERRFRDRARLRQAVYEILRMLASDPRMENRVKFTDDTEVITIKVWTGSYAGRKTNSTWKSEDAEAIED